MLNRKCERCGADFQAKAADVKRGWGRFCSKSCKAKTQTVNRCSEIPTGLKDDIYRDAAMYGAFAGWEEGGWLSDDSGTANL